MNDKNNYRILVVDDSSAIHQDFRKILCPESSVSGKRLDQLNEMISGKMKSKISLPPFHIDTASQSLDAIELIKKSLDENKPYAVVFLDVLMPPGDDGIETLTKIWSLDPNIQTVICTAYAKYSWEDILKQFGETDRLFLLKKPFDNLEVIQMACCLAKKWNLAKEVNAQLSVLKNTNADKGPEVEKSMKSLKKTIDALAIVNDKLKKG